MTKKNSIKPTDWHSPEMTARIKTRYRKEKNFHRIGVIAITIAVSFLIILLGKISYDGVSGFFQTRIDTKITFSQSIIGVPSTMDKTAFQDQLKRVNFTRVLAASLQNEFPDVNSRSDRRRLLRIYSIGAREQIRLAISADPSLIGQTVILPLYAADDIDQVFKGNIDTSVPEANRRVKDKELSWLQTLIDDGRVYQKFHTRFFTAGDWNGRVYCRCAKQHNRSCDRPPRTNFLMADSPERAFLEKTSAAIMVLLMFLVAMNGLAIWLRQKFE